MKNKAYWLVCSIFILFFAMYLIIFQSSVNAQEFSAQIKIEQPEEIYYYDYFVKDHFYRLEGKDSNEEPIVIIANRQIDSYLGLHPIMKFYMEFSKEEIFLFNPIIGWEMITDGYQEEKTGTEVIAGFECEKYVYSRQGLDEAIEVWYSPELKQRIKVVVPLINANKSIFELLDIQIGNQDDDKFLVPADYIRMDSPAEQIPTNKTEESVSIISEEFSGMTEVEAPVGRVLGSGSLLQIKVIPGLEKNLVIENKGDKDAYVTVIPIREGEVINEEIIEKAVSPKGKIKPSFSSSLKINKIEVKVQEGTVQIVVIQESHFTDKIERKEYYLFENFGQGLFFSEDKEVQLTIIGDNEKSAIAQGEVTFFKGEYQDPIETIEFSLEKGEIQQWAFQPGEIKTVDIVTGNSNGGIKIIFEQFNP
ncbi:MAG: hypothetical protein PHI72_00835 [Atribacterota bacterium]|jgi:hypothetical protein|nr:hypothetical protein [Atribacterota bacterium]MDD4895704.1 hypothetical protein [Atribacterota bacterium]MDD5636505.1 hypothetical protein [Atribacterota bacterium]